VNTIKSVAKALRPKGFTYVMDSTLYECDACGERVPHSGRRRHGKTCPAQQPFPPPPEG
jgi:hypothetical protein